ncbi:2844_t:CDS:2 [Funneliformis caledonium]|uniref:2844_t:CDS:1 n=1 Tax=Funneliformis caledonium TaxID=1117310 RepID=A0A9N9D6B2_9GLOM|nr:2844_t:CDS:2 [Funneliformis caledonium]
MSSSVTSAISNLLKVKQVKSWSRENFKKFMQENRASLDLEDGDIDNIYNQRIDSATFLELTQEDLTGMRTLLESAKKIVKLIKEIQGAGTSKSPTSLVSVFVNNSNLFIEEKFTVSQLESAGTFDQQRNSHYLNQLHINHGRLLSADQNVSQGYDVVMFDQNIENKEKKVDMELGASAMDVIWTRDPGIFVLVSEDGVSGDLTECFSSFYPLDNYYKYFTYAYRQDPVGKNHILEITDGEMVGNWKGEEVKNWMESKHSDIKVWEMPEIKRRSWVVG